MSDETGEFLRHLMDREPVPRDIVPGAGMTRETMLRQNAAVGTWSQVTVPGEVLLDVDGCPIGMTASTTEGVYFGGVIVTRSQLARLGLTPEDVPKLHEIDDPKETNDE